MGIKKSLLLITLISALTLAATSGCRGDGSGKTGGDGNSDARSTVNRDSIDCDDDVADSCDGDCFIDTRDGRIYRTVEIGGTVWMAENLRFKASGSWCYEDEGSNCKIYGRLYDWHAARKACPDGWHLPRDDEWDHLARAAGGEKIAGNALKSKVGWQGDSRRIGGIDTIVSGGTDEFGFSALPGGFFPPDVARLLYSDTCYGGAGTVGYWWSTKGGYLNAYRRGMYHNNDYMDNSERSMGYRFSVRCVLGPAPPDPCESPTAYCH